MFHAILLLRDLSYHVVKFCISCDRYSSNLLCKYEIVEASYSYSVWNSTIPSYVKASKEWQLYMVIFQRRVLISSLPATCNDGCCLHCGFNLFVYTFNIKVRGKTRSACCCCCFSLCVLLLMFSIYKLAMRFFCLRCGPLLFTVWSSSVYGVVLFCLRCGPLLFTVWSFYTFRSTHCTRMWRSS